MITIKTINQLAYQSIQLLHTIAARVSRNFKYQWIPGYETINCWAALFIEQLFHMPICSPDNNRKYVFCRLNIDLIEDNINFAKDNEDSWLKLSFSNNSFYKWKSSAHCLSISLLQLAFKRYKHETIQIIQFYTENFRKIQ